VRGSRSAGTISPLHGAQDGPGDLGATIAPGALVSDGEVMLVPRAGVGTEAVRQRLGDGLMVRALQVEMVWMRVNWVC
jgi:hypothetical protein